jgi:PTS system mannose-specific IID component
VSTVPRRVLVVSLLRSFAVQGSWNYRTLLGCGFAFALLPVLRNIYASRPEELQAAVQRHTSVFNSHPYLSPMALGAVTVLEATESPALVERFKSAVRGSLGSLGDRVIWAGLRPACALLGIFAVLVGMSWGVVVIGFLVLYNIGHLTTRFWAMRFGLRHGKRLGEQLRSVPLDRIQELLQGVASFALGLSLPLVLAGRPVLSEPNALWFAVGVPGAVLGLFWDGRIRIATVFALTLVALAGIVWGAVR